MREPEWQQPPEEGPWPGRFGAPPPQHEPEWVPPPGPFGSGPLPSPPEWPPQPGWPLAPDWARPPQPPRRRRLRTIETIVVLVVLLALATTIAIAHVSHAGLPPGLAGRVDAGVVDVVSTLGLESATDAGTGIVLRSSGEVLTNNHVIDGATSVSVTDVGNGRTYSAVVVGTDAVGDLAVIQLQGASGLRTVAIGDSSKVAVGDPVIGFGNAGGLGGTPSTASGTVTALDQSIVAMGPEGLSEQLAGLIETNAPLEPGDSGGPLVNARGQVIGVDTAASNGYTFQVGANRAFAIPINTAMGVAGDIEARHASATIHIGPSAFLGVEVENLPTSSGALVVGVVTDSPAQAAGLVPGDVIVALDGQAIHSAADLGSAMRLFHPGNTVELVWLDQLGRQHTGALRLVTGPAD